VIGINYPLKIDGGSVAPMLPVLFHLQPSGVTTAAVECVENGPVAAMTS
jgi:hypothetical protein